MGDAADNELDRVMKRFSVGEGRARPQIRHTGYRLKVHLEIKDGNVLCGDKNAKIWAKKVRYVTCNVCKHHIKEGIL